MGFPVAFAFAAAQFNKQEWRSYADLVALKQSSFSRVQLADKEQCAAAHSGWAGTGLRGNRPKWESA